MKFLNFTAIVLVFFLTSCSTTKTETFWVSGQKTPCDNGAGRAQCLNIYKGNDLENAKWQNFYNNIEGFTFEEGYLQNIKVNVQEIEPEKAPADASSLQYSLVEVLEKKEDTRAHLTGKWVLNQLNNAPLENANNLPVLNIDLNMGSISGIDGCNNYTASITNVTQTKLQFGTIAATRKMCVDMTMANNYSAALSKVNYYVVNGNKLELQDNQKNTVLTFEKFDAAKIFKNEWTAVRINGNPINRKATSPTIRINAEEMMISGTNGCNNFSGKIKEITESKIELNNVMVTEKMCLNMETPTLFNQALQQVKSYAIENNKLIFYDSNNKEILMFLENN
ncbi:META domain-containing protein [Flavobacterium sp.]|uniref:META domain-containing protein n=1 Tax=Flavobacterium sp. TaxID=239 RepID=UPI003529BD98